MRRSAALTPLSHDHHQALFLAFQLKRAADVTALADFLAFIDGEGHAHFEAEETVLLPRWLAADPGADHAMGARVVAEHRELRATAERMRSATPQLADLHAAGELLEQHVRFEERELFPLIEAHLNAEDLQEIGALLEEQRPEA
jgi:hemerythrin-like domain-containing protein